jgi:hypothetical protein
MESVYQSLYSVTCRDNPNRPGHGGRYGKPGDLYPLCGETMFVTGTMLTFKVDERKEKS